MATPTDTGVPNDSLNATVAQDQVTVLRSDVKKETTFKKFLAMLANTILTFRTTSREDIRTGQIDVPADTDYPVNIVSPNPNRGSITLKNVSTGGGANVWIGSYDVKTTTGFLLRQFESITLDRTWGALFARATGSASIVAYIEE